MPYSRHAVLTGQDIALRVVFTDGADTLVDTDADPEVYFYDPSVDYDTMIDEIEALTFTSAIAGPEVATGITTGYYEYTYTVPNMGDEGIWYDVWVAQVDGVTCVQRFSFNVVQGATISIQSIPSNYVLIVELDETIADIYGNTLGVDQVFSFATRYSPLYASPDLFRLELGAWLDFIPDDTLALILHWSSKLADHITPVGVNKNNRFKFARTRFVLYDAALRAYNLPGVASAAAAAMGSGAGARKRLGDLEIDHRGVGATIGMNSAGIDLETLKYIRTQREEWFRVVNAGATIMPGQGFAPVNAIRGKYDLDRRLSGRLWEDPSTFPVPGANTKILQPGYNRGRWTWRDRNK